jgi:hypothetical protein
VFALGKSSLRNVDSLARLIGAKQGKLVNSVTKLFACSLRLAKRMTAQKAKVEERLACVVVQIKELLRSNDCE